MNPSTKGNATFVTEIIMDDHVENYLKLFTYFHPFDETSFREAVALAKILNFKKNDTVIGDDCGYHHYVYFIVSGKCQLVENILMSYTRIGDKAVWKKYQKEKSSAFKTSLEFIQICLFGEGSCLGLGENMKNRRIIAIEDTKCILLPRYWLWSKGAASIWSRTKCYLERKIPKTEKVIQDFIAEKKFQQYKDSYVNSIVGSRKAFIGTNIYDVPLSTLIKSNF